MSWCALVWIHHFDLSLLPVFNYPSCTAELQLSRTVNKMNRERNGAKGNKTRVGTTAFSHREVFFYEERISSSICLHHFHKAQYDGKENTERRWMEIKWLNNKGVSHDSVQVKIRGRLCVRVHAAESHLEPWILSLLNILHWESCYKERTNTNE